MQNTHPDLVPYCNRLSCSHWNAALYVSHYIHSTIGYGIQFASAKLAPLHTYMHFSHSSDTEAYTDPLPPKPNRHHQLTTYSNVCWGSQIGNAVREEIQLPLIEFRSMRSTISFRSGSPITWRSERQDRTSLSSYQAEIRATNAGFHLTMNVRNMMSHLSSLGYPIMDTETARPVYNNNKVSIKW
jgi:hypothetical protein